MALKQQKEVNILLLGETGVGKSTFINGFANYLNYETLEEAEKGETICLIPTQFVVTDANFEQQFVKYGQDHNEAYERAGESVTQQCRAYSFNYGEILIRLIDTPGVGDTRGLDQDKINLDNLLSFIAEYEVLHLICILLKPDMARLTSSFKYCLKQLLCHLQKDASKNMVFVFTNSRSTFYRPKNTLVLLRQILGDIKNSPPNVDIPLEKHTMYCLDNDSFQLLIALRNNITFADDEKQDYANSWAKSVNECVRLVNYIMSGKDGQPLPPHSIQNTLSINETRRLIVALNKPIAKIAEDIGKNLIELENSRKEVENFSGNIKELLKKLDSNDYKFELSALDFVPIVNLFTISYKKQQEREARERRSEIKDQMEKATDSMNVKKEFLDQLRKVTDEYKQERKKIVEASAKFAYFLKNNAIAAYNDEYKDYLLEEIENVKKSNKDEKTMREEIQDLTKILNEYEEEKEILDKNIKKGNQEENDISLEHINDLINELYELKVCGKEIIKLHEESKSKQSAEVKSEVVHKIEPSRSKQFFKAIKFW